MQYNLGAAILLTTLAGLSTVIGSLIAFVYKKPGPSYMTLTMGFSAGVMIFVSFVELLGRSIKTIGFAQANIAFFIGLAVMFLIDVLLSHKYMLEEPQPKDGSHGHLLKTSILVTLGIAIHNFPEGMATFAATLSDMRLGVLLAFAIAVHNIPEGMAVAIPIYAATQSRKKAFFWSFASGASEPLGAAIAGFFLLPFLNNTLLGWILCTVAGFMVYISFDELLPVSRAYGKEHLSIIGVMLGMLTMAISLALF